MSPSYKDGDSIDVEIINANHNVSVNDIVIFMHPLKKDCKVIKRVTQIKDDSKLFVEGDNPDFSLTDDSHNFGYIDINNVIAIKKNQK